MAKTLKLNVVFPMTVVVNTESVNALEASRAEAREAVAKAAAEGVTLKGEVGAMVRLFSSEITTEALLEIILRKGIREIIRAEMTSELNNAETGVRVGDIKVSYETREVSAEGLSERWTKTL